MKFHNVKGHHNMLIVLNLFSVKSSSETASILFLKATIKRKRYNLRRYTDKLELSTNLPKTVADSHTKVASEMQYD